MLVRRSLLLAASLLLGLSGAASAQAQPLIAPAAAPGAAPIINSDPCAGAGMTLTATVPFTRTNGGGKTQTLKGATLQVWRSTTDAGSYCLQVDVKKASEIFNSGGMCLLIDGAWSCNAGWDWESVGTGTRYTSDRQVSANQRYEEWFRLGTGAKAYVAGTGYLTGP